MSGGELAGPRLPQTPDKVLQGWHPQLLPCCHPGLLGACQKINQHLWLQTIPKDSSASLHGVPDGGTHARAGGELSGVFLGSQFQENQEELLLG